VSQGPGDPRQGSDTTAPNGLGNPVIAEWRSGGTSRRRNDNRWSGLPSVAGAMVTESGSRYEPGATCWLRPSS